MPVCEVGGAETSPARRISGLAPGQVMLRGNRNHACRFEKRRNCFANVDFLIFFPLSGKIDAPISHELSPPDRIDDYSRTLRLIGSAQVVTNSQKMSLDDPINRAFA
jgi:hypothetical protein